MLTSDQLNSYRAKLKPQHTTEEHKKEIGGNLQKARKKTGLTQEDVTEILGWGGRKVGRIESGETLCSPEDILSLCQIYDCSLIDAREFHGQTERRNLAEHRRIKRAYPTG